MKRQEQYWNWRYDAIPERNRYKRVAKLVASDRFDLNVAGSRGTVLHFLAERDFYDAVRVAVVRKKSQHRGRTDEGRTPLIVAAIHNSCFSFEELVKYGANVNAVDNKGRSVLHYSDDYRIDRAVVVSLSRRDAVFGGTH